MPWEFYSGKTESICAAELDRTVFFFFFSSFFTVSSHETFPLPTFNKLLPLSETFQRHFRGTIRCKKNHHDRKI